jgi:hypothetical protein
MSLRPPQPPAAHDRSGTSVLDYEIAQQKAQSLGRIGHEVEQALARLRACPAGPDLRPEELARRSALVDHAADRVWALMIQRELCGLRHWDAAVKSYAIPREVLNRVGRITTPA